MLPEPALECGVWVSNPWLYASYQIADLLHVFAYEIYAILFLVIWLRSVYVHPSALIGALVFKSVYVATCGLTHLIAFFGRAHGPMAYVRGEAIMQFSAWWSVLTVVVIIGACLGSNGWSLRRVWFDKKAPW